MIIANIPELLLFDVADRGIPNSERVQIRVEQTTDMGRYGIMVGYANNSGFTVPFQDNLYWFGDGLVHPGDWILVYTGSGEPRTDNWTQPPGSKVYSIHWGRSKTMFANSQMIPILFRTDAAVIGNPPGDVPQLGRLEAR